VLALTEAEVSGFSYLKLGRVSTIKRIYGVTFQKTIAFIKAKSGVRLYSFGNITAQFHEIYYNFGFVNFLGAQ
jgi:hypothetical protein